MALAGVVLCAQGGCSAWIERRAIATTAGIIERSKAAMQQESDVELARAAIPSGLKQLEGFYVAFPDEERLRPLLAEAVCQYGAGFLQDDWEAAVLEGRPADAERTRGSARRILGRCVNYGLLLLPDAWARALWHDPAAYRGLIDRAGRDRVAGMFWVALGLGALAGMFPDDPALGAYLPLVRASLHRVTELDARFQDGLADLTLGILYASRSAAVGGDPERGKRHFARAQTRASGRSLMIDVLFARYYAVTVGDRALFRTTLVGVLRTSPAVWPENRLVNEMAHRKARRYLAAESRWFAP